MDKEKAILIDNELSIISIRDYFFINTLSFVKTLSYLPVLYGDIMIEKEYTLIVQGNEMGLVLWRIYSKHKDSNLDTLSVMIQPKQPLEYIQYTLKLEGGEE